MDTTNPYNAPTAHVDEVARQSGELAGRADRFAAFLLDLLIQAAVMLPVVFVTGLWSMLVEQAARGPSAAIGTKVLFGVTGFVVFLLVQGYPLHTTAQTWGKRVLRIRIARIDGAQPSLAHIVLRRYLPMQVISAIPLLGTVLGLVDSLLIFRADRRCGHDLIAGTRVVHLRRPADA